MLPALLLKEYFTLPMDWRMAVEPPKPMYPEVDEALKFPLPSADPVIRKSRTSPTLPWVNRSRCDGIGSSDRLETVALLTGAAMNMSV